MARHHTGTGAFDIGVLELLRHPGTRRRVDAELDLAGVGLSSAQVTARPVSVDAVLEAQGNKIVVTGHVEFEWMGSCRRCLEPITGVERAGIQEIFEPSPVEGETWLLDGDHIDLWPLIREVVTLSLPLAPLCSPDCRGPDPDHYPTGPAGGAESRRDPRWAPLDQLKFD